MPQNKPITYIALIEYLQSYETIKKLIDDFLTSAKEDFEPSLLNKIKINNPNIYDLSMEDSFNFLKQELDFNVLNIFEYLSNEHYLIDNGKVKLCGETLEEYHMLSSSLDTSILYVYYLSSISKNIDSTNKLRYIDSSFSGRASLYGKMKKKITLMSDNHIHLGGAVNFNYSLHRILKNPRNVDISRRPDELFLRLTECHISIKNILLSISALETMIILFRLTKYQPKKNKKIKKHIKDLLYGLRANNESDIGHISSKYKHSIRDENSSNYFHSHQEDDEWDYLRSSMRYFKIGNILKADKFLNLYFLSILHTNVNLKEPIEIYIILRNILKVYLVQQHRREGFGYFATYTDNKMRRSKDAPEKENVIKLIYHPNIVTNIEGRITLSKDENRLVESMLEYIRPFEKQKKIKGVDDKLKFMFHFIKEQDNTSLNADDSWNNTKNRWEQLREEFKHQTMVLNKLLINPKYRKYNKINIYHNPYHPDNNIQSTDETIDFVRTYISGIDVANKEYKMPPEVLAPIYRFFKSSLETSGRILSREYPFIDLDNDGFRELDFQYSYHVGEDFRDILSGLRAIFETVIFLNYKENDRIGHGLALGVDVQVFYAKRENRKMSKLEVLDNSIFAYYILDRYSHNFTVIKDDLKDKILGLSKEIYLNNSNKHNHEHYYHIDDLIGAWFLRRNCPNEVSYCMNLLKDYLFNTSNEELDNIYNLKELLKDESLHSVIPNISYIKAAIPDFFPSSKNITFTHDEKYRNIYNNKNAYDLYWIYNTNSISKKESSKIYQYDHIYEFDFYEYMQDIIMEYIIAKEDIIIESLPSSNILIGQFKHYIQHPITRFKSVEDTIYPNKFNIRTKNLRVILGTDNPGLQNTTLLGEIYQLKNALEKSGKYSKSVIEQYLLEIIEEGNELWR